MHARADQMPPGKRMSLTKKFASCRFSLALAMYAIAAMLIARETVVMQSLFFIPDNTTGLWGYRYRATP
ncbi:hypothetical protein B6J67_19280 [Klebsiella quasipneumoniae]|nr:hypothetical protein B6J67_19280 [Klebsiella quasipneumoniae]